MNMMRVVLLLACACIVLSHPLHNRYISVEPSSSLNFHFAARVPLAHLTLDIQNDAVHVHLPGQPYSNQRGLPRLPVLRQGIVIPERGQWAIRVVSQNSTWVDLPPRLPVSAAIGPVTRQQSWQDINQSVDLDVSAFSHNELYPSELVRLRQVSTMRDVRCATLEVRVVQYSHNSRRVRVTHDLIVELVPADLEAEQWIESQHSVDVNAESVNVPTDADFLKLYDALFINFHHSQQRQHVLAVPHKVFLPATSSTVLIIYGDTFAAHASDVSLRLRARGWSTIIQRCKDLIIDPNFPEPGIKAFTQKIFNSPDSFSHLLLIGNDAEMPSGWDADYSFSVSDMHYVKFGDDDDYSVSAFVSRLFANTSAQGWQLVDKVFSYDDRAKDAQWVFDEFGMGSAEGAPTDCQNVQTLQSTDVNGTAVFKNEALLCDSATVNVTVAQVKQVVESGVSLIQYIGHGTGTSWYTSKFGNQDASQLTNTKASPFIVDVACMNGEFRYNLDPFAGRWLLGNPAVNRTGAIGMYASAPPADWAAPVTMSQGAAMLVAAGAGDMSIGGVAYGAAMYALQQWPDDEGGKKIAAGYILYGASFLKLHAGRV